MKKSISLIIILIILLITTSVNGLEISVLNQEKNINNKLDILEKGHAWEGRGILPRS